MDVDLIDLFLRWPNARGSGFRWRPAIRWEFAARVRRGVRGLSSGAVGLITDAGQANEIIATGKADLVMLARQLLRDPYWPLHAARELGATPAWPAQYLRAAE